MSKQDRPSRIRVFVAVELPEELRESLGLLRFGVGPTEDAAKWVAPNLIHTTLRFLGEIPAERVGAVETAAREAALTVEPFVLQIAETGAFPHPRRPRVLWVGLQSDAGLASLQRLQVSVEQQLEAHDFEPDPKPFSPHITVARLRDHASPEERQALGASWLELSGKLDASPPSFKVNTLTVMRSDLRQQAPQYTPLARLPLNPRTEW